MRASIHPKGEYYALGKRKLQYCMLAFFTSYVVFSAFTSLRCGCTHSCPKNQLNLVCPHHCWIPILCTHIESMLKLLWCFYLGLRKGYSSHYHNLSAANTINLCCSHVISWCGHSYSRYTNSRGVTLTELRLTQRWRQSFNPTDFNTLHTFARKKISMEVFIKNVLVRSGSEERHVHFRCQER